MTPCSAVQKRRCVKHGCKSTDTDMDSYEKTKVPAMSETRKDRTCALPAQSAAGKETEDPRKKERDEILCALCGQIKKNFEKAVSSPAFEIAGGEEEKELLWKAILLFEDYIFQTQTGLEFSYAMKRNKAGAITNELYFSRKKKGITRGTIFISYDRVAELRRIQKTAVPALITPKQLGTFGASYMYGVFMRFGLITAASKKKELINFENK